MEYPNRGVVGNGPLLGDPRKQPEEQKLLDGQTERLRSVRESMSQSCARIESALQRICPEPQSVSKATPEVQPGGALHRLELAIEDVHGAASWLGALAQRLDRIA